MEQEGLSQDTNWLDILADEPALAGSSGFTRCTFFRNGFNGLRRFHSKSPAESVGSLFDAAVLCELVRPRMAPLNVAPLTRISQINIPWLVDNVLPVRTFWLICE